MLGGPRVPGTREPGPRRVSDYALMKVVPQQTMGRPGQPQSWWLPDHPHLKTKKPAG
jgi:hypothetical protein